MPGTPNKLSILTLYLFSFSPFTHDHWLVVSDAKALLFRPIPCVSCCNINKVLGRFEELALLTMSSHHPMHSNNNPLSFYFLL